MRRNGENSSKRLFLVLFRAILTLKTNTMIETLASIEAHQKAVAISQTWGHLAPKPQTEYKGTIIFTLTAFGETCLIDFNFEDLEASPWLNLDILDYITAHTNKCKKDFAVFKWNGMYKKFKNGNFKFKGTFKEILL